MKKTNHPVRASPAPELLPPSDRVQAILTHFAACRRAKAALDKRFCQEDAYWEGRLNGKSNLPPSAWLFNAVANKHADAMDAYPNPSVLPREPSDEQAAASLTAILPVILTNCGFAETYSTAWWEKLKHGTAAYGVFWNPARTAGSAQGDVDIRTVDLRQLYWDPGVRTLEESCNLYLTCTQSLDSVTRAYCPYPPGDPGRDAWVEEVMEGYTGRGNPCEPPSLALLASGNPSPSPTSIPEPDAPKFVTVVDRYYKITSPEGKHLLHYMKIAGSVILYDSAKDPNWAGRGLYDHGQFPVVLDTLYPAAGSPWGYGMIAVCRAPQDAVDALSANMVETGMMGTKKRFFASESTAVNEREFLDWNRPIVHVQGDISDARLKEITVAPPDSVYWSVLQGKIQELKETVGNRDVNAGSTGSGVTSAAAISALQEAGDKLSRDMIAAAYRTYEKMLRLVIELIRQFYTEERVFRITGAGPVENDTEENGERINDQFAVGRGLVSRRRSPVYVSVSSKTWSGADRAPVFDLVLKAERQSAASRNEQNELALELFRAGFFDPANAEAAEKALSMMDFSGVDLLREQVGKGQSPHR